MEWGAACARGAACACVGVAAGWALHQAMGSNAAGADGNQQQTNGNELAGRCSHRGTTVPASNVAELIGNTPLIRIQSLSEATGCNILGKAEFQNPGGSIKDRVALQVIECSRASSRVASSEMEH